MRALTIEELSEVGGGYLDYRPPWDKDVAGAAVLPAALAAITALVVGLATEYVYDWLGEKEGIDQKRKDLEKWADEKAKELSALTDISEEQAKCVLKTLATNGVGGGAGPACSFRGASGSW